MGRILPYILVALLVGVAMMSLVTVKGCADLGVLVGEGVVQGLSDTVWKP